jgi:NADH-ubiquinone oxidoreductase chain 4
MINYYSIQSRGTDSFFVLYMLLSLLLIPILGVLAILINKDNGVSLKNIKFIALTTSILNLFLSLIIFILFDFSTNQFQFVQEYHEISYFDFYLGVDGLSIYFILLTTIIIPISLLSNWTSISEDVESYVIIILLLETLLLAVFLVLDILLFYIFFESILPPLFILIGMFGSDNRVKASFYLFLYTLLGSLFLLLSILAMSAIMSTTDFDTLFKGNFIYLTQLFLFYGIFIAFAVKTPTIFLNTWLLKAHVESPLGGSIILAAIVLKLSLYGILRLILPILPKAYMEYTYIIYAIGVITIIYASLSTLRTIDIKELIAYSSVSHAAVYLLGVFSNSIQGIEGSINLGLAHGLVSPGLFICAGGILYDRSHTRLISFYRGMGQIMPLFAILFFILCLANCGAPLTLNFVGEFMSLYGVFERSSFYGVLASSSIIFSAAYTIYMYQRISFGGSYSRMFTVNIPDLNKREFIVLLTLVIPTVLYGIYTAPILDAIHYSVSTLIYSFDYSIVNCDASMAWGLYFQNSVSPQMEALVELHNNIVYYLAAMLFSVVSIGLFVIKRLESYKSYISNKYDILLGFVWRITPTLNWILIIYPYVKLLYLIILYLIGEVTGQSIAVTFEYYLYCLNYAYTDTFDADLIDYNSQSNSTPNGDTSGNRGNSFSTSHGVVANCEHPEDSRVVLADDASFRNNPVECTYCTNNALDGTPLQQAIVCHDCGATICEKCNDPDA